MKNSAARKLKQVTSGYLRVGVEPHRRKHAAVAMTQYLMVQSKFKFVAKVQHSALHFFSLRMIATMLVRLP
jgi:hypothetical protein